MPELPEVETTRRGIAPHLAGRTITAVQVYEHRLRWPIPADLDRCLVGRTVRQVQRRAKYLLLATEAGSLILHLGMSGSLRLLPQPSPPGRHDHVDIRFDGGLCLRLTDPRRFGAVLWTTAPPEHHRLLAGLGPEPLSAAFDGDHLYRATRNRTTAIKSVLMDGRIVVGVGNIYANEALFQAGIDPARAAKRLSRIRCARLAQAVKSVLHAAIDAGGTTLRDFVDSSGRPGYFVRQLAVYGKAGENCPRCGAPIAQQRLAQRSTFHCKRCQR